MYIWEIDRLQTHYAKMQGQRVFIVTAIGRAFEPAVKYNIEKVKSQLQYFPEIRQSNNVRLFDLARPIY